MGLSGLFRVPSKMVNVPKTRRTYCKGKKCRKHTLHKVSQYKAGKACMLKENDVTIVNKEDMVVRLSLFSTKRRRLQKKLPSEWNALNANSVNNYPLNVVNTLSWVVIRERRAR